MIFIIDIKPSLYKKQNTNKNLKEEEIENKYTKHFFQAWMTQCFVKIKKINCCQTSSLHLIWSVLKISKLPVKQFNEEIF